MNKLSQTTTLVILSVFLALPMHAAAERGAGMKGPHKGKNLFQRVGKMQKKLDLTDEQADKVFEIFKSSKGKKGACKSAETFTAKKACMEEKRSQVDSQISAVLNEDQKAKYSEMKAKRKAGRKGKRQ